MAGREHSYNYRILRIIENKHQDTKVCNSLVLLVWQNSQLESYQLYKETAPVLGLTAANHSDIGFESACKA